MTKIEPIKDKTEIVPFGNEVHNDFWQETRTGTQAGNNVDNIDKIIKILENAPPAGVICIFSGELSGNGIYNVIEKARNNGNRIYILTNTFINEMRKLEGCLIRYNEDGKKRSGSFILINPKLKTPSGCIFTGSLKETGSSLADADNLLLILDSGQIETLFRYFCYQFWKIADKEHISMKDRETAASPIDIYPAVNDSCDLMYLSKLWNHKNEDAVITTSRLINTSYLDFLCFSKSRIYTLYNGIDSEILRSLKENNNDICALNYKSFINSIKIKDDTWLIIKADDTPDEEIYSILLNKRQESELIEHINALKHGKPEYRYVDKRKRENLENDTIIPFGKPFSEKINIKKRYDQKVSLRPSEFLPYEKFIALKPEMKDVVEGNSRYIYINYTWNIIPLTLPNGSKEHELYAGWEKIKNGINKYIDDLNENTLIIEKGGNSFTNIIDFLSGKKQEFSKYRDELNEIKITEYSALEPNDLKLKINRLNNIKRNIERDTNEISEQNRKVQIEEKIKKCRTETEALEKKCVEKEEILKKFEQETESKENNFKEDENNKMIKKEIKELKIQIKNKNNEINQFNEQINKPVKQNDKKQLNHFKYLPDLQIQIPKEKLPEKGKLFNHDNKKYLAIEYWEDYETGKKEAERLGAILCAKGV